MLNRREVISIGATTATVVLAGCSGNSSNNPATPTEECDEDEDEESDEKTNWRQPVSLIKSIQTPIDARIRKVEFYQNGSIKIHPDEQPECYDTIIFKHRSTSVSVEGGISKESIGGIGLSSFRSDNVLTVYLKGMIDGKCNYPSNKFEIQEVSSEGICSNPNSIIKFEVPESYMD